MINLKNKKLFNFRSLFLIFSLVSLAIIPTFAIGLEDALGSPEPSWFKYLEIVGGIIALVAIIQGMMLVSRSAGGSLSKSFLWYPIGAMFIALSLVLRMIMEWGDIDFFALEFGFEICIYIGLVFWVIGTQKSINALK